MAAQKDRGGDGGRGPSSPPPAPPRAIVVEKRRNLPGLLLLGLALLALLAVTAVIISPFVTPLLLALIIATVTQPAFQRLLRLVGEKRRGIAAAVACTIIVLGIFIPLAWVSLAMVDDAKEGFGRLARWATGARRDFEETQLYHRLQENDLFRQFWGQLQAPFDLLEETQGQKNEEGVFPQAEAAAAGDPPEREPSDPGPSKEGAASPQPEKPGAAVMEVAGGVTRFVGGFLTNVVSFVLKFLLMVFILFFFYKDGPLLLRRLRRAIPLDQEYQERVIVTFREVTRSIIRGAFGTALVQGTVAGVVFTIVGLPGIFLGGVAALAAMIPPLGTSLVTVPITVSYFISGQWGKGAILAAGALVIGVLDNLLYPTFVGKGLRVHPVWLLLSILGAIKFFGGEGIIYGPMTLVFLGTFIALFVREEGEEPTAVVVAPVVEAKPPSLGPPPPPVPS